MSIQLEKRLFSVDEYHKMVENGILSESDNVELIDGEILKMAPIGSRHAAFVDFISDLFRSLIKQQVIIRIQNPVYVSNYSEPEPDIAIVKYRKDFYIKSHPKKEDILLIIEITESSINYDREIKLPKYAEALITEVWILIIPEDKLEIYRNPVNGKYQDVLILDKQKKITPLNFKYIEILVGDLFVK